MPQVICTGLMIFAALLFLAGLGLACRAVERRVRRWVKDADKQALWGDDDDGSTWGI